MKFLYISLIALGMTFIFSPSAYALHPLPVPVLSMKSNTIGHIYVKFSTYYYNQTLKLGPMDIYDANLTNHDPLKLDDLSVIQNRTSITLDANNTIIDYTVTVKNNLKGIYALPIEHLSDLSPYVVGENPLKTYQEKHSKSYCHMIPLVIGLDSSQIKEETLDKFVFLNASENCPVSLVDMWFTGRTQTIERMPGTYITGVEPITASMDKDVYFPGDNATVRGYLYTNDTNVTIELEKNHSMIVESKNVPVMQNKTFVSSFIIPTYYVDTWSITVSSKNADGPVLYLNFDSSPLKQYKSGTDAKNVVCKREYQLMFKAEDGSPACVKPDTKIQLLKIGWAVPGPKDFGYNTGRGPVTLEKNTSSLSGDVSSYVYGGPLGSMTNRSSNYVVSVYMTDGITLVGKTVSDSNAHYFMHLPAGNYTIYTYNEIKQKYTISVFAGKNTVFNIKSSIRVP